MRIAENKHCYTMQFFQGFGVSLATSYCGEMTRTQKSGKTQYHATNNTVDAVSEKVFMDECMQIDWAEDIQPLLSLLDFEQSSIMNMVLNVTYDRTRKHFYLGNGEFRDSVDSTHISLNFMYPFGDNFLTIRRDRIVPVLADKKTLLNEITDELTKINADYATHLSRPLIPIAMDCVDVILPAGIGGVFVHESIGHCLEADFFCSGKNVLFSKLGQKITNSNISISDNAINTSLSCDGTPKHNVALVSKGRLTGVMTDKFSAERYGIADTGNGRAMSYRDLPMPRMRNTYLHNGDTDPYEITRSTKNGVIATEILGGSCNCETGNFVFNIAHGLVVKNGQITGISEPLLFTGDILNALDTIDVIGNDLGFAKAKCGKNGQTLTVSYGQPTIRISKQRGVQAI